MCKMCKRYRCPPNCPSYEGRSAEYGKAVASCRMCGAILYEGDNIFTFGTLALCRRCASSAEIVSGNRRKNRCEER